MKKMVILLALFLTLSIGIYHAYSTKNLSELQLANIEALANGETGTSNTGPREKEKCYGGGHKMVCRAINSPPCQDSDCF